MKKNILCWPWSQHEKKTFGGADEAFLTSLKDHNVFYLYDIMKSGKSFCEIIKDFYISNINIDYFLVYYPETLEMPCELYKSPYPLIAFVCESNVRYHLIRQYCDIFDYVILDVEDLYDCLYREGVRNIAYRNWWGFHPKYHQKIIDFDEKDIDLLFIGNLNSDVQEERGRILFEIASHGFENAMITTGVYEKDYCNLLNRAKIIYNLNVRGEINMRSFEAPAVGALMLVDENDNIKKYYIPGKDCVTYERGNISDIISKVEFYLKNDSERICIAKNGYETVQKYTYQSILNNIIDSILNRIDFKGIISRRLSSVEKRPINFSIITAKSSISTYRNNDLLLKEYNKISCYDTIIYNNIGVFYYLIKKDREIAIEYLQKAYDAGDKLAGLNLSYIINDNQKILEILLDVLNSENLFYSLNQEFIKNDYWYHRKLSNLVQEHTLEQNICNLIDSIIKDYAYGYLAKIYLLMKQPEQALGSLKNIRNSDDYDVIYTYACIYEKLHKYDLAADYLHKAIYYKSLDPRLAIKYIKMQIKNKNRNNNDLLHFIEKWIDATKTIIIYSSLHNVFKNYYKEMENEVKKRHV